MAEATHDTLGHPDRNCHVPTPFFRSPFTDLTGSLLNTQHYSKCGPIELKMMECLEAYGIERGKKKCADLVDDYFECFTMRKQQLRTLSYIIRFYKVALASFSNNTMSSVQRVQQWATFARQWHIFDAAWQNPYEAAPLITKYLRGMHKPICHPLNDSGDHVVVINTADIALPGDEWKQRAYFHHTGYPGGASWTLAWELHSKDPTMIIKKAVYRCIGISLQRRHTMQRLHLFKDANVPKEILENVTNQIRQQRPRLTRDNVFSLREKKALNMVMAENSMHHCYNRHEGFIQPTLVENRHHFDFKFDNNIIKTELKKSSCVGCGREIQDQYILRVAPDLEWHAACLKCQECQQFLDENCTCFVRDGKTYCKRDYVRLFGTKCDKCGCSFRKNDFVMRAKTKIYHIKCFRCTACERQLKPGDEFALREGGTLYCKNDHDQIERMKIEEASTHHLIELSTNNRKLSVSPNKQNVCNIKNRGASSDFGSITDSESETDSLTSHHREKSSHTINGKPARVRTVLNEKQLSMLRACYQVNSRPDALVKEQLVEMTGLSPRVVRVWFQNKRCKDKKKSLEMKLQIQQEKEGKISYMNGIPLIASPPVKHESPLNYQGYEVTKYQPPWRTFSEFAIQNESDDCLQTPGFQHLVNQLHGYDLGDETNVSKSNYHEPDWHKNRDSIDSYQESEENHKERNNLRLLLTYKSQVIDKRNPEKKNVNQNLFYMVMAEIQKGGPMAHQLPLHNHRGGLVQPSLVVNHHHIVDTDCNQIGIDIGTTNIKKQRISNCVGCGGQIYDQYILRVAPDLEWHAACLKCQECRQFLDESCTCFVRDGKTYCKRDYVRLFGTKCDKCGCSFSKNDFVMRAKSKIFHLECFRCTACSRHLIPGDEFALRDGNTLFCKMDNDALDKLAQSENETSAIDFREGSTQVVTTTNSANNSSGSNNNSSEFGSMSESESESGSHKNVRVRSGKPPGSNDGKTRVRTVLNEKQLHTLSTFFNANPRPDALMKEQLVEMTGLSPRVIRVWFQNKRCKHNKKTNALKIQMEQEKEMKQIGYGRMHGVPLIATSPVRNDESPINLHGFEVTSFQPPWKMISDLAMHADSKNNQMHQMHSPAYQDIVNQISCHFRDVSV
ncbi:CLUMA_CG014062, isoform A [Clunio marinus]|uniref:Insulin gene enhancer protein ISL-1 n=1 Tax=Clunio marinus TaxID=568069 RepID=A0A1J1IM39_9DIPT|nr:CLUMA_CG014062, isoform A [Clunio marinus]